MGLFDRFKKENIEVFEKNYKRYVIVGNDWSALSLYWFFRSKFGKEEVLLLDSRDINEDNLFFPGPCIDRGEQNINIVKNHINNELSEREDAVFYKDQQFRNFGGRVKPFPLLDTEPHFIDRAIDYNQESLLEQDLLNNLETIKEEARKGEILKIESLETSDLIDRSHFRLFLKDHNYYDCEYLFYGHSPQSFLGVFEEKTKLNDGFVSFSSGINDSQGIVVQFKSPTHITDAGKTYFIPQSQTHEWGHFVCEFFDDANGDGQIVKTFCRVSENEMSEDDISKKLKLLKRTLSRVFEGFCENDIEEKIWYLERSPFAILNDDKFQNVDNFFYFGWNAPIGKSFIKESFFECESSHLFNNARALLSLKQIQKNF